MKKETLQKANELSSKIRDFEEALNCFEWSPEPDSKPVCLNPRLIIEYDGDGREQIMLPMNLNSVMVSFLKDQIVKGLNQAKNEFDLL